MGVSKLQTFTFQEVQDFPGISSFDFAVSPEFMTALCAGPSLSPRKSADHSKYYFFKEEKKVGCSWKKNKEKEKKNTVSNK